MDFSTTKLTARIPISAELLKDYEGMDEVIKKAVADAVEAMKTPEGRDAFMRGWLRASDEDRGRR